jgi:hypothetical protein
VTARSRLAALAALTPLAALAPLCTPGCTDSDPAGPSGTDGVDFQIAGLPAGSEGEGAFELWISFALTREGGGAVPRHSAAATLGRFRINDLGEVVGLDGQPITFAPDPEDESVQTDGNGNVLWQLAVDAFVTLEPEPDPDPAPRLPGIIAGGFLNGFSSLDVNGGDAIRRDFSTAAGAFHLATPTTSATDDELRGVWFAAVGGGSGLLTLPGLPSGWVYEGWVSQNSLASTSLGRFTGTTGADSDGGGPLIGDSAPYAFPGSDFPFGTEDLDLTDGSVFVTLEPAGNEDGSGPFFLELLGGAAPASAGAEAPLTNVASFPTATVTIPFQP